LSRGLAEAKAQDAAPGAAFLEADSLAEGGPRAFLRAVERLLLHLGFDDIRDIDGPGDQGGDILAFRRGLRWVFQCKWTSGDTIGEDAVREVDSAKAFYRADRAVVATNARPGRGAINLRNRLQSVGVRIDFWDAPALATFATEVVPEYPPARIKPHEYQAEAILEVKRALAREGRAFAILATGLGKTVVAGEVIHDHLVKNTDGSVAVLIVAHLKELVQQLERACWRHLPSTVTTGILTGDEKPPSLNGVVCATVESALKAVNNGWRPSLVVVDEAHHVAETGLFQRLLDQIGEVPRLGLTATPWRGDKYDIGHVFGEPVFTMGIAEGMAAGFLSEVDYRLFLDEIDWQTVRDASEYGLTLGDLNHRLFLPQRDEAVVDAIREHWSKTRAPRAVVFCRTIAHAEEFAQLLREAGWRRSECLNSGQSRRERNILMSEFRDGRVPIITTVDLLNEGVDVPDVNIICFLRVTHSRRIFVQQLGRGLRLREGKDHVAVLDFVSDLRRIKATLDLKRALADVPEDEIERLHLRGTSISFSNPQIGTFLEEWLKDTASLEEADEEVRLEFPPITTLG
jgi:superfamily II DNA or RNA helicase